MDSHPAIYVAIFNPELAERLNKQFQPQGLEPKICDTVQIKRKTGDSLLRFTEENPRGTQQPRSSSTIMLTTVGNKNTYQFFASFMLFPHFMLKVFTFFAFFLEFKFLRKTSISRSASPHSYNA